ncbi:hypothetical protein TRVA0_052S00694 [Trichomonascus vanleenenianus]|uniref:glucosamine-6-phosphate deaminase n=1 Tax=Trichomonascus vanleenenianus TaxID=2268995 RepID=UPI003ECA7877
MVHSKVFKNSTDGCSYVAEHIIKSINDFAPTPDRPFVLGLPTGSSPEQVYANLVRANKEGRVTFKNVVTFNMDEYVGLDPKNEQSYHYFMEKHFFSHVDLPRENINILNGQAADPDKECAEYEEKIKRIGGIHLFMGGIGNNGHIAFNEVGSTIDSVTRKIDLDESTIQANARFFSSPEEVPRSALSVGIATVLGAREVVILAFGSAKSTAVRNSLEGEMGPACPGSYTQTHTRCTFVLDEAAASGLTSAKL